jgi:hypothetical protein
MTAVYFRLRLRDHKWGQKIPPSPKKQFFLLSPLLLTIAMAIAMAIVLIFTFAFFYSFVTSWPLLHFFYSYLKTSWPLLHLFLFLFEDLLACASRQRLQIRTKWTFVLIFIRMQIRIKTLLPAAQKQGHAFIRASQLLFLFLLLHLFLFFFY